MILGVWEFECPVLGVGNSQTYGITDLPVLRTWCLFKELDFLVETESFQLASFRMRRRRDLPCVNIRCRSVVRQCSGSRATGQTL